MYHKSKNGTHIDSLTHTDTHTHTHKLKSTPSFLPHGFKRFQKSCTNGPLADEDVQHLQIVSDNPGDRSQTLMPGCTTMATGFITWGPCCNCVWKLILCLIYYTEALECTSGWYHQHPQPLHLAGSESRNNGGVFSRWHEVRFLANWQVQPSKAFFPFLRPAWWWFLTVRLPEYVSGFYPLWRDTAKIPVILGFVKWWRES